MVEFTGSEENTLSSSTLTSSLPTPTPPLSCAHCREGRVLGRPQSRAASVTPQNQSGGPQHLLHWLDQLLMVNIFLYVLSINYLYILMQKQFVLDTVMLSPSVFYPVFFKNKDILLPNHILITTSKKTYMDSVI